MASEPVQDKRILARQNVTSLARPAGELPDLADRIFEPTEEEVEAFRVALGREQVLRGESVERALERASRPPEPPPTPEIPLDVLEDFDLTGAN